MPFYVYEDIETKERHTIFFEKASLRDGRAAHPIGEVIEHDDVPGRTLRRIADCHIDAGVARKTHGYPFESTSLPKGSCPDSQTKDGKPIIRSQRHEAEVLAQTGFARGESGNQEMLDAVSKAEENIRKGRKPNKPKTPGEPGGL